MTRWYEVTVTTEQTFAVEVEDDESEKDAIKFAEEEAGFMRNIIDTKCFPVGESLNDINNAKACADEVLEV